MACRFAAPESRFDCGAAPASPAHAAGGYCERPEPRPRGPFCRLAPEEPSGSQTRSLLLSIAAFLTVIIAGGGLALYQRIGTLDSQVRAVQASIKDLKARTDRAKVMIWGASSGIVGLLRVQSKTGEALACIETAATPRTPPPPPGPVIVLTPETIAGLRTHFSLTPASEPARFRLGDTVPADALKPLPAEVAVTVAPQLNGMNYLIDRDGALVVTAGADHVVVLIVEPG